MSRRPRYKRSLLLVLLLTLVGCASVPKEVVKLSYTLGTDIQAVHSSYTELIKKHFSGLRADTERFLNTRWVPIYLEGFILDGELAESVQGSDPAVVLEDVQLWVEVAMEEIEDKKRELLAPIEADEDSLITSVNQAFALMIRANSVITAHLNSIREIKEVHDEVLEALNLKELRDKINVGLAKASEKAAEAIKDLEKAEKLIDEAEEKKEKFKQKREGAKNK